jgi:hypothetical protein
MAMQCALVAVAIVTTITPSARAKKSPRDGWGFAFKDFVIGA